MHGLEVLRSGSPCSCSAFNEVGFQSSLLDTSNFLKTNDHRGLETLNLKFISYSSPFTL